MNELSFKQIFGDMDAPENQPKKRKSRSNAGRKKSSANLKQNQAKIKANKEAAKKAMQGQYNSGKASTPTPKANSGKMGPPKPTKRQRIGADVKKATTAKPSTGKGWGGVGKMAGKGLGAGARMLGAGLGAPLAAASIIEMTNNFGRGKSTSGGGQMSRNRKRNKAPSNKPKTYADPTAGFNYKDKSPLQVAPGKASASKKSPLAGVGTAERKAQYDKRGWAYDDTIKGYNRDGSQKAAPKPQASSGGWDQQRINKHVRDTNKKRGQMGAPVQKGPTRKKEKSVWDQFAGLNMKEGGPVKKYKDGGGVATVWDNLVRGVQAEKERRAAPPKYKSPYAQGNAPKASSGHPSDGRRELVPDKYMPKRYAKGGCVTSDQYGDYTRSANAKHIHRKG